MGAPQAVECLDHPLVLPRLYVATFDFDHEDGTTVYAIQYDTNSLESVIDLR